MNEKGFSLLEVTVAVAIMAALTGFAIAVAPSFVNGLKSNANSSADCGLKQEAAAMDLINGNEPDQYDTINGEQVAAHECQIEKDAIQSQNANGGN